MRDRLTSEAGIRRQPGCSDSERSHYRSDFENDPAPEAYERLVDRYLHSPWYGVRWARHWLDVVRFGESNGFEFDEPRPNAWPYRDWVVNAGQTQQSVVMKRVVRQDELVWLAGAGLQHGIAYGATDEIGWKAVENRAHWHDFHATVLHLLGIDHERLTYYHNGIKRRLTNVHGRVIRQILA